MNSERRHELQKNELADVMGAFITKLKPYAPAILTAVVVLIIGVLTLGYLSSRAAEQRSDATLTYLIHAGQADAPALAGVAANYPGTKPATLAILAKADIDLAEGVNAMFTMRERALGQIEAAAAGYSQTLKEIKDPLVQSRAALGLARAQEALGNVDESIAAYEQVIAIAESEAMVEAAEQRIASLKRPETQEFLAWFIEQRPETIDPASPPGVPSGDLLPEEPDMVLPDAPVTPGADAAAAIPGTEPPADGEMQLPPATEPPADEPPADEPPADEPPADEPPADEPPADEPPADEPPADEPPADEPPADEPPADEPPADEPPADEPPADEPPADEPPADEPPADEPPADEPPADDVPPEETPAASE